MSRARPRNLASLATLVLVVAAATATACSDPGASAPNDADDGEVASNGDSLVGAHVYSAPAKPTVSYPPPAMNAIYVAPTGSDASGSGAIDAPYKSIAKAIQVADAKTAGPTWTIVLRGGTYREGALTITRDAVTVQRYLSEPVSILGSVPLTGFSGAGPYTLTITSVDTTPIERSCADASLLGQASRDFGSDTPIAVTRAGVPLRRVATGTIPASGQYTYDPSIHKLVLRDSPTQIELAYQLFALRTKASNVKLAGLDIEGYATCTVNWSNTVGGATYYKGAVLFYKDSPAEAGDVLESSTVANNAASGLAVAQAHGVRITGNTIVNNGWNGANAATSNDLVVDHNEIGWNNVRRWSNTVEAGMKITNVKDGVIFGNVFEHNAATGFWCDQACGATDLSVRWFVIAQNVVRDNDGKGIFYEVSHHAVIASNVVHDNGLAGIAAFGSRSVQIWNNTAVDNNQSTAGYLANVALVDDKRCYDNDALPGNTGKTCTVANGLDPHGGAYPNPDHCEPHSNGPLANTCNTESATLMNNIVSGTPSSRPLLLVDDPSPVHYGGNVVVTASDYQAYWRPSTSAPASLLSWQTTPGANSVSYATLAAFRAADPSHEAHSVERTGGTAPSFFVDYARKDFTQSTSSADVWGRGAPLPPEVLAAVYWPSTSPAQPTARVGAIAWTGKAATLPPPPTCLTSTSVYHVESPTTGDHLFTTSSSEAANAATTYGYTTNDGVAFSAFAATGTGLSPVYRMYDPTTRDHLLVTSATERTDAAASGYTKDEGIHFYASTISGPCFVPVTRLVHLRSGHHEYTVSASERDALVAAGWTDEGVKFYASAK